MDDVGVGTGWGRPSHCLPCAVRWWRSTAATRGCCTGKCQRIRRTSRPWTWTSPFATCWVSALASDTKCYHENRVDPSRPTGIAGSKKPGRSFKHSGLANRSSIVSPLFSSCLTLPVHSRKTTGVVARAFQRRRPDDRYPRQSPLPTSSVTLHQEMDRSRSTRNGLANGCRRAQATQSERGSGRS